MTPNEVHERLLRRLHEAGISVRAASTLGQLVAYYQLLAKWNRRLNLTALPLDEPSTETFDRLFIEPLAAARLFSPSRIAWFDLGSGGGSPAIPLKVVLPSPSLTMVESKARKAAFLREVVRTLRLDAAVATMRFEELSEDVADVVTVRAVRLDEGSARAIHRALRSTGQLVVFHSVALPMLPGFITSASVRTPTAYEAHITALVKQ